MRLNETALGKLTVFPADKEDLTNGLLINAFSFKLIFKVYGFQTTVIDDIFVTISISPACILCLLQTLYINRRKGSEFRQFWWAKKMLSSVSSLLRMTHFGVTGEWSHTEGMIKSIQLFTYTADQIEMN